MSQPPTPFEALQEAVTRAGSQSKFGKICGISQPSVWKMLQSTKRLPAEYVLSVEAATNVSRHYLRPDIYPMPDLTRLPPLASTRSTVPRSAARRRPTAELATA